jgi:hypothetical protein
MASFKGIYNYRKWRVKVKYLEQLVRYFKDNIEMLQSDVEGYRDDLRVLHKPFPLILEIQNQDQFEARYR